MPPPESRATRMIADAVKIAARVLWLMLLARDQRGDAGRQLAPAGSVQGPRPPRDAEAALRDLRDDVEVHVEHRLVRGRSVVLQDVVGGGSGGLHHGPAQPGEHSAERGRALIGAAV